MRLNCFLTCFTSNPESQFSSRERPVSAPEVSAAETFISSLGLHVCDYCVLICHEFFFPRPPKQGLLFLFIYGAAERRGQVLNL